jgi:hypothetical protein
MSGYQIVPAATHRDTSMLIRDYPPDIYQSLLPQAERDDAHRFSSGLHDLSRWVGSFEAAVALFESAAALLGPVREREKAVGVGKEEGTVLEWQHIAARDGAMSIYHFGKMFEASRASIGKMPTVLAKHDKMLSRQARKLFEQHFPNFLDIRHAVAHSAELTKDQAAFDKNAFTGSYSGPGLKIEAGAKNNIVMGLTGTTFATTHEGRILTYDITRATLDTLGRVLLTYFSAFAELGKVPGRTVG